MEVRINRMGADLLRDTADLIGQTPRRLITENTRPGPRPSAAAGRHQGIAGHHGPSAEIHDADRPGQGPGSRLRDGQVIRVVNTMSNRTVEAVVIGPNQVSVSKPGGTPPTEP